LGPREVFGKICDGLEIFMSSSFDKAVELLKQEGFRLTGTRRSLVKAILNLEGHWTIQDTAARFKKELPGIGIATVYRTVQLLARLRLLSESRIGGGAARYEVADSHHHDHLTCKQCGEIFEFENDQIERLQSLVAKQLGFKLVDHKMELYGDCVRKKCPNLSRDTNRTRQR